MSKAIYLGGETELQENVNNVLEMLESEGVPVMVIHNDKEHKKCEILTSTSNNMARYRNVDVKVQFSTSVEKYQRIELIKVDGYYWLELESRVHANSVYLRFKCSDRKVNNVIQY